MKVDGNYYDVLCGKSLTLVTDTAEIETTNVNSTYDQEFVPGMCNHTLTINGVSEIDNRNENLSALYLWTSAVRRTIQEWRVYFTDQEGNVKSIEFRGFIKNNTLNADVSSMNDSSITVRVTGGLTLPVDIEDPVPPANEVEEPIYLFEADGDITAGQYTAHSDLLEQDGVVILSVARSGAEHYYTSGTPASLQYTTDLFNGDIIFSSSLPFNAGEAVYILYRIEN